MPQKRKASELASAKIAENAAVNTRRRKSDPKNVVNSNNDSNNKTNTVDDDSNKNLDDNNKESLKNNNEEKDDSTEAPPDKRRRKSEEDHIIVENNQQKNGSNSDLKLQEIINDESMMSISSIKSTQENDSANKMDYEPSSQKEEEKKPTTTTDSDKQSYEKIRKEDEKEFEKKMHSKILEKGHICFLYRPKVGSEEPKNVEEIQRMYIVLLPHVARHALNEEPVKSYFNLSIESKLDENSNADKTPIGRARVIAIGKKKLPEIEKHSKLWGFIDKAFSDLNELKEFVSGRTYQTATKGQRSLQDCRIFGRGAYSIVEHNGHTHLAYVLEIPEEPNEVQKEFNVKHEGSYVISVKNPDITNPLYLGLPEYEKVIYPEHLMQKFQKRRFISTESIELLDYNGAELLFIGAKENLAQDLGEAGKGLKELAEYEIKTIAPFAESVVFDDLHLEKDVMPAEPLHGLWK